MKNKAETNKVDFQKAKNRASAKRTLRKLRIPACILAVLIAAAAIYTALGETRRSNFADSFKAIPSTLRSSAGYPFNEDDLSLEKLALVGDKPMLISKSSVQVLSQEADILQEIYPDWADTRAVSVNGRALIYSNNSNKAMLISRTDTLASFSEEGTVVTGAVSRCGRIALSYTTDKAQSVVKVYSPRQKTDFQWNCSRDYVSSLSISSSGKAVLISAMGVDNAEIYSRIVLFKTSKTKPEFDVKIENTSIIKVVYAARGKYVAIGDNKTLILNSKGEIKSEIPYSYNSLFAVDCDSEGNTLLCCKISGGSKIRVMKIPSLGSVKQFDIDYTPASADIRKGRIALAIDNTVNIYSPSGFKKETYTCDNNVSTALITSAGIYTLENGSVCKY